MDDYLPMFLDDYLPMFLEDKYREAFGSWLDGEPWEIVYKGGQYE